MLKVAAYQQVNLPEKIQRPAAPQPVRSQISGKADDFRSTLDTVMDTSKSVRFSAHAKARLHSRGVSLDQARLDELSQAIDKAEARGARESLVLTDEAAYVVSVSNRTVITAFDRDSLRDGVFTSIDSAVIL